MACRAVSSCRAAPASRSARRITTVQPARLPLRNVRARAEGETPAPETNDAAVKLQAAADEAVATVKKIWDNTSDGEKPAAIAILIGVVVAQISIGATVDAVDKIPFINKLLQLVGVAVTSVFAYRYFTDPEERVTVKKSLDGFVKGVTGDK